MLRGDLETTPLADLLRRLSDAKATGCVYVLPKGHRSDRDEAVVMLRNGEISSVSLPGAEDAIATRLVASRRLSPVSLAQAHEAQETELANWTLAELLIHLGLADEREVHELVVEQALSDLTELCNWPAGGWRFRRRERWGPSLPEALGVEQALVAVAERKAEWLGLLGVIRGAEAVVSLAADPDNDLNAADLNAAGEPTAAAVELDADGFGLLCAVDGTRTVGELGSAAGFTMLDAGRTIAKLVDTGLVQVALDEPPVDEPDKDRDPVERRPRSLDAIAAALSFNPDGPLLPADLRLGLAPVGASWQAPRTSSGDPLSDALARVSAALTEAMSEPRHHAEQLETAPRAVSESDVDELAHDPITSEAIEPADAAALSLEDRIGEPAEVESPAQVLLLAVEAAADPADVENLIDEADLGEVDSPAEDCHLAADDHEDQLAALAALAEAAETAGPAELEVPLEVQVEAEPEVVAEQSSAAEQRAEDVPATVADDSAPSRWEDAADAARLLSQLAEEPLPPPVAAPPVPSERPPATPANYPPRQRRENGLADTAALLRELSSLGSETSNAAPRPATPRPVSAPTTQGGQHARRRKGLFGRG